MCVILQYATDDDLFKPTAVAAPQQELRDDKREEEEKDDGKEGRNGAWREI